MRVSIRVNSAAYIAAALVCTFIAASSARGQQAPIELKASLYTPPAAIVNAQFKKIKDRIERESDGKIRLTIYESGQMGPAPRQFDLVRTGVADISLIFVSLTPGRFPLSELGSVPNLITLDGQKPISAALSSAFLKNAEKYLAKEYEGVRLVNVAITPAPVILTKNEVKSLANLKNLRVRHGGKQHADTIQALGAVPVSVSPTELAESLARGRIDGVLGVYSTVTTFQLQDSAKNIIEVPGGGLVFSIIMNPNSYSKIPADLKPLVDKYFGPDVQPEWSQLFIDEEAAARKQLEAQGVVVRALSQAEQQAANKTANDLREKTISQVQASGQPAREFVDALQASAKSN